MSVEVEGTGHGHLLPNHCECAWGCWRRAATDIDIGYETVGAETVVLFVYAKHVFREPKIVLYFSLSYIRIFVHRAFVYRGFPVYILHTNITVILRCNEIFCYQDMSGTLQVMETLPMQRLKWRILALWLVATLANQEIRKCGHFVIVIWNEL